MKCKIVFILSFIIGIIIILNLNTVNAATTGKYEYNELQDGTVEITGYVGTETELYSKKLYAKNTNWIINIEKNKQVECYAKIRYRAKEAKAKLKVQDNKVEVIFDEPQRAITNGQSVVFYDEDGIVLGGGTIIDSEV